MATYAIGDVQGCFAALQSLLKKLRFKSDRDRLWFVGDLVNRGPQSLATLRFVRDLGGNAVTVLGNHDLHLLNVASGCRPAHNGDTLQEILEAPDRVTLLDWLRTLPLVHSDGDYLMVHAGLLPAWTADDAQRLSAEVETALQGSGFMDYMRGMYGDQPRSWSDDLAGIDRLRLITNAMTRMRICTPAGAMEFKFKGPPQDIPDGYLAWFDAPARRSRDKVLVAGHWSALGLNMRSDLLALDSGCLWGGELTAICLEDRAVFQAKCD